MRALAPGLSDRLRRGPEVIDFKGEYQHTSSTRSSVLLLLILLLLFRLDIHKNTILLFDVSGQTAYRLSFHS